MARRDNSISTATAAPARVGVPLPVTSPSEQRRTFAPRRATWIPEEGERDSRPQRDTIQRRWTWRESNETPVRATSPALAWRRPPPRGRPRLERALGAAACAVSESQADDRRRPDPLAAPVRQPGGSVERRHVAGRRSRTQRSVQRRIGTSMPTPVTDASTSSPSRLRLAPGAGAGVPSACAAARFESQDRVPRLPPRRRIDPRRCSGDRLFDVDGEVVEDPTRPRSRSKRRRWSSITG